MLSEDKPLRIEVSRNRAGSFEPLLIPKYERRFTGFDDKIVAMYAREVTIREILGFLAEQYGIEVSPEFISVLTQLLSYLGEFALPRRSSTFSTMPPSPAQSSAMSLR